MRKRKYFPIVTVIFLLIQSFSPLLGLVPVFAANDWNNNRNGNSNNNQGSCPTGNGWSERITPGGNGNVVYNAPEEDQVITEVCIKGEKSNKKTNLMAI